MKHTSNKGEAVNALRRAVLIHRSGEIRDHSYENQSYRASGLNLAVAMIVLWNTVYLARAVEYWRGEGENLPDELLAHISPMGWGHIGLSGDYVWTAPRAEGGFRPLRMPKMSSLLGV
jgi:hypothetical protein